MSDITLEAMLKRYLEYQFRHLYTAIPAVVMQVDDAEECRVDVKPVINEVFPDYDDSNEFPIIFSVPVIFPSSGTSAFTYPISPGDTVLLVFSQASTDVFRLGDGTPSPPSDYRKFDKRDAIAIPGLWPFANSKNKQSNRSLPHSTEDVVIAHNLNTSSECEIRLKASGKVEITSPLQVEVKAPVVNVTATTSSTVSAPAIYATATTLATISAPIANIAAITSATITSPIVNIASPGGAVSVTSTTFTWNGSTVAVV